MSFKDRGAAICSNKQTISAAKVVKALVNHLQQRMARPDRVQAFVDTFKKSVDEMANGYDPVKKLDGKIAKQERQVDAVTTALLSAPTSKALADRLVVEEKKLTELQAERETVHASRPKVLPHPAAIARYVEQLAQTIEQDAPLLTLSDKPRLMAPVIR